jgi:hypothetical protein
VPSAERGGVHRGSCCSGAAAPPAGQEVVREVGVGVQGGDEALNLVGSGLRPCAPRAGRHGGSEDGLAHARRGGEQAL